MHFVEGVELRGNIYFGDYTVLLLLHDWKVKYLLVLSFVRLPFISWSGR